jgi:hypothetical protein
LVDCHRSKVVRYLVSLVSSALLLVVSSLSIAEESAGPANGESSPAHDHSGRQAVRVYVDPETGQLVSRAVEARALALGARERQMLSRSSKGLKPQKLANGGVALNLQGRFQSMVMVATDARGEVRQLVCLIDEPEAATAEESAR